MLKIIVLLSFLVINSQKSIANNQQNDSTTTSGMFMIKDSTTYNDLSTKINLLMKKDLESEFSYDYHVKIYDISNKNNKKYFAIIGCFVFVNACKGGQQIIIVSNQGNKMKILHQLPYLSDEIVAFGKQTHYGFKEIILNRRIPCDENSVLCKVSFSKKRTTTNELCYVQKPDIPYSIIKDLYENDKEEMGINRIIDMIELKNIDLTQNKKSYKINYWSKLILYECDLEGINCKLVEQK